MPSFPKKFDSAAFQRCLDSGLTAEEIFSNLEMLWQQERPNLPDPALYSEGTTIVPPYAYTFAGTSTPQMADFNSGNARFSPAPGRVSGSPIFDPEPAVAPEPAFDIKGRAFDFEEE